jgi:hypothetical protein
MNNTRILPHSISSVKHTVPTESGARRGNATSASHVFNVKKIPYEYRDLDMQSASSHRRLPSVETIVQLPGAAASMHVIRHPSPFSEVLPSFPQLLLLTSPSTPSPTRLQPLRLRRQVAGSLVAYSYVCTMRCTVYLCYLWAALSRTDAALSFWNLGGSPREGDSQREVGGKFSMASLGRGHPGRWDCAAQRHSA